MALDPDQLKQRFRTLTGAFGPAQLTIIGVLGVLALIAGMAFYKWASAPSYSVLYSGLDASDTAAVVEQLNSQGVAHKVSGDGNTVLVPADKVHTVRLAMSAAGLPSGGTVGYELLDNQGLTTSEFRQKVDYQRALQGELTRTLTAIKGVSAATVHLAIPEERLFSDDEEPTRASVLLRTNGPIGDEAVQSIVHLVASSVPGLEPANVTVADVDGRVLSSPGNTSNLTNRQLDLTKQYETQLGNDASTMLAQVFGSGHAVVRVSAQLNFDESERESETYDPTNATAVREQTESETYTGGDNAAGGELGVDPVQGDVPSDATNYERTKESREFGIDRVVERSRVAPGRVERLSVAVVLDATADPVPDPTKVESLVAAALGIDAERGDSIVVDTIEFDTTLATAAEEAEAAVASKESQEQLMTFARTGVGALVLLLVVFFLIKGTRGQKIDELDVDDEALAHALAAAGGSAGALPAAARARMAAGVGAGVPAGVGAGGVPALPAAGSYDDQVLSLIDQQPDEVASLLRGWLADRRS